MRIRKRAWVDKELEDCPFFIKNPQEHSGPWKAKFEKEQPLYLELGCGKGSFIAELAKRHPENNYIAVDVVDTMLGMAQRNVEKSFNEAQMNIENVLLMQWNIEKISQIFNEDKVERIYINFCNPWPRPRHNKRRLTHPRQLVQYKNILQPNGEIYFKTDDMELYQASLRYFNEAGFEIVKKTEDLHKFPIFTENIITEHEDMFTKEGIQIKAIIARS